MRLLLFLSLAVCAAACSQARADMPPKPPPSESGHHGMDLPDHFTNLKVLPADTKKDDLMKIMRAMSAGLGVRCGFCHVMEPKKDWAADTKKEKGIARGMMKMTERINKEMFTWTDAPRATCYMCHHGEQKPVLKAPPHEEAPKPQ